MITPNLFLVGAPRCATTSIANYLSRHPLIVLSEPKEPHFFGADLYDPTNINSESEYLASFGEPSPDVRYFCDASVWYLYSQLAAEEIHAYSPDAKILISLRNPFDLIASLHAKHVYERFQPITDFAEAYRAHCGDGQRPRSSSFRRDACYSDVVDFVPQILRYSDRFGHENIHIVLYDEIKAGADAVCSSILEFLGLPRISGLTMNELNRGMKQAENPIVKSMRGLNAAIAGRASPNGWAGKFSRRVEALLRRTDTRLPPPPLPSDIQQEIRDQLQPDLVTLEKLLGRSVSHWLEN